MEVFVDVPLALQWRFELTGSKTSTFLQPRWTDEAWRVALNKKMGGRCTPTRKLAQLRGFLRDEHKSGSRV